MTKPSVEYRVYRNGKSKAALPNEAEAFDYVKRSAMRRRKAEFLVEKREIIFDSSENANDRKRLEAFRKPDKDDTIEVVVHGADEDLSPE